MATRQELIEHVAGGITHLLSAGVVRVGIDGVDGAGKTVFGDDLAAALAARSRRIIRASVDGFHNPRALRYRQGRNSPQGYFEDSYDYARLRAVLLDPLSPGGSGRYRSAAFDHRSDAPVDTPEAQAAPGDILVLDGIFLHRPELRNYWDFSIFLEVGFAVSVPRFATRDAGPTELDAPMNQRYILGQQLYIRTCVPAQHATLVIDNTNFAAPHVVPRASAPQ